MRSDADPADGGPDEAGFTLVELQVAIVAMAIIFTAFTVFAISMMRDAANAVAGASAADTTRIALMSVQHDVQAANPLWGSAADGALSPTALMVSDPLHSTTISRADLYGSLTQQCTDVGTLYVASTAGFASTGQVTVTTSSGLLPVSYTGTTATGFTGCVATGGDGTITAGDAVVSSTTSSTVDAAMNGASLASACPASGTGQLDVSSVYGFPDHGELYLMVQGAGSPDLAAVSYTGVSTGNPPAFTGCTVVSGSGVLATGGDVLSGAPVVWAYQPASGSTPGELTRQVGAEPPVQVLSHVAQATFTFDGPGGSPASSAPLVTRVEISLRVQSVSGSKVVSSASNTMGIDLANVNPGALPSGSGS